MVPSFLMRFHFFFFSAFLSVTLAKHVQNEQYEVKIKELGSCSEKTREAGLFFTVNHFKPCTLSMKIPNERMGRLTMVNLDEFCEENSVKLFNKVEKTVIDLCEKDAIRNPIFHLAPGHHSLVYKSISTTQLYFSLTFINTTLYCGDRIHLNQLDFPLTLKNQKRDGEKMSNDWCEVQIPGSVSIHFEPFTKQEVKHRSRIILQQGTHTKQMLKQTSFYPETHSKDVKVNCGVGLLLVESPLISTLNFTVKYLKDDFLERLSLDC
ncbi:unnamed protein product, partial [Mesorhabditis belari]|uniref:Uncharacterized protein n=1 Tax=Mesorhabditis belari TaxID=2138241 RepID=A0AAF3EDX9_9BILA